MKARDFETDGTGQLALPLAGRIDANNKTLAELEAEVVERLRQAHVRNPQVSINVREINSRTVTVDGSVREPGPYPAVSDLTLMRAIARAVSTESSSSAEAAAKKRRPSSSVVGVMAS